MTAVGATVCVTTAAIGGSISYAVARRRVSRAPTSLLRSNFRGATVAAVLGDGVVAAGVFGILAAIAMRAASWGVAVPWRLIVASAVVIVVMYFAGAWDDRRGDERPRGFKGHLTAARGRSLTGGIVKSVAGVTSGVVAGAVLGETAAAIAVTALLIALSANLANLLDRAPGRTSKVAIAGGIGLAISGPLGWAVVASGLLGGVVGSVGLDLAEKAMLGDAGANPLGGLLGLGLAVSLAPLGRAIAVVLLLVLNLASERWSFSRAIESNRALDYLDRIGRK
ncbi:MAG: hypothetical protein M3290_10110 [Actinomycetota bacterium]|nr:hypothetical protein [Actinomycetota bacterium]